MQDIVKMHVNPVLSLIMINVILTPSGLGGPPTSLYGWVDGVQVYMFLLGEYCLKERELPRLSHVSRLGSDLGFNACYLAFEILLYLEFYLVEIFMLLDLFMLRT